MLFSQVKRSMQNIFWCMPYQYLSISRIYQLLLNKFPTHTQRAQILQVPEQFHFQSCKTSFAERGGVLRSASPHFSTQSSETDQWTSTLVLMKFSDLKYTGLLCSRGREIHNPSQTLNAPQVVSGNSIGKIPLHSTYVKTEESTSKPFFKVLVSTCSMLSISKMCYAASNLIRTFTLLNFRNWNKNLL